MEHGLLRKKEKWFGCKKSISDEYSSLKQVELAVSQWKRGFWKKVISHKYGEEDRGWRSRAVSERYGVGLWKAIRKEWIYLSGRLAYQVDNGQRMRFWMDKWCGDESLCESFPSLFSISSFKEVWVSDVWNPNGDGGG